MHACDGDILRPSEVDRPSSGCDDYIVEDDKVYRKRLASGSKRGNDEVGDP
jgi:hypothetical protein